MKNCQETFDSPVLFVKKSRGIVLFLILVSPTPLPPPITKKILKIVHDKNKASLKISETSQTGPFHDLNG